MLVFAAKTEKLTQDAVIYSPVVDAVLFFLTFLSVHPTGGEFWKLPVPSCLSWFSSVVLPMFATPTNMSFILGWGSDLHQRNKSKTNMPNLSLS